MKECDTVTVRERIDKQEIFFGTPADLKKQEKKYWDIVTSKEKSETITYLRERFKDRRQLPEDFKKFIIFLNKNEVNAVHTKCSPY